VNMAGGLGAPGQILLTWTDSVIKTVEGLAKGSVKTLSGDVIGHTMSVWGTR
jgi:hypothetical protein